MAGNRIQMRSRSQLPRKKPKVKKNLTVSSIALHPVKCSSLQLIILAIIVPPPPIMMAPSMMPPHLMGQYAQYGLMPHMAPIPPFMGPAGIPMMPPHMLPPRPPLFPATLGVATTSAPPAVHTAPLNIMQKPTFPAYR